MKIWRLEVRWQRKRKQPQNLTSTKSHRTLKHLNKLTPRKDCVNSDELDKWFAENYTCQDCHKDVRQYNNFNGICTPNSLSKEK